MFCATKPVEGIDQLHLGNLLYYLNLGSFLIFNVPWSTQLLGDFRQRPAHVMPLLHPAWENSAVDRGNTRIAYDAARFRGASLP